MISHEPVSKKSYLLRGNSSKLHHLNSNMSNVFQHVSDVLESLAFTEEKLLFWSHWQCESLKPRHSNHLFASPIQIYR